MITVSGSAPMALPVVSALIALLLCAAPALSSPLNITSATREVDLEANGDDGFGPDRRLVAIPGQLQPAEFRGAVSPDRRI